MPGQQLTEHPEHPDSDPAHEGGFEAVLRIQEAGTDHQIRLSGQDRSEDILNFGSQMLPVPVEFHGEIEPVLLRENQTGLHGAADSQVHRQREHGDIFRRERPQHLFRPIGRRIIHKQETGPRHVLLQLAENGRDGCRFIVTRNNDTDFFLFPNRHTHLSPCSSL